MPNADHIPLERVLVQHLLLLCPWIEDNADIPAEEKESLRAQLFTNVRSQLEPYSKSQRSVV